MNRLEMLLCILAVASFVIGVCLASFKRCRHNYHLVRTIYGDEINYRNGKRKVYSCAKCGKVKYE